MIADGSEVAPHALHMDCSNNTPVNTVCERQLWLPGHVDSSTQTSRQVKPYHSTQ